jgi:hypothetical protein
VALGKIDGGCVYFCLPVARAPGSQQNRWRTCVKLLPRVGPLTHDKEAGCGEPES